LDLRGYEFYKTSGAPISGATADIWDAVDGTPGGAPLFTTTTTATGKWEFLALTNTPKDVRVTFTGSIRWYKGLSFPDFSKLFVGAGGITSLGTVGIGGVALAAADLALYSASSKIVPGTASFSVRNNANSLDNLFITDAGLISTRNSVTLGTGASLVVPQPNSTPTFGVDAGNGPSVAVPNATAYGVFGAANVFGGLLIVHDVTNGEAALVLVASATTSIVFQSGTTFSATAGAATKTSVYLTSGAVTIQNQLGATHSYQFLSLRSRGLA
jgi:hypothetical protein